jgi:hypothetical protein
VGGGLLIVAAVCCSGRTDEEVVGHQFETYLVDGVTVARSSSVPRYDGELFSYEIWYTVQSDDREESLLVRPEPGCLDDFGRLYLPDSSPSDWPNESRIAVFDSTGTFLFSFGQPGEGPGDMRHPLINRIENGVIETSDRIGRHRLSSYSLDGALLDLVSCPDPAPPFRNERGHLTEDGTVVLIQRGMHMGGDNQLSQVRAVGLSAGMDSLWSVETEKHIGPRFQEIATEGAVFLSYVKPPYGPVHQAVFSNKIGLILTGGEEPILDIYGSGGEHRLRVIIDLVPEEVLDEDRTRCEDSLKRRISRLQGLDRQLLEAQLKSLVFPEYKAFWGETKLGSIEIDDSGLIWVRVPAEEPAIDQPDGPIRYRIVSPEGEYLGVTQLPDGSRRGMTRISKGCLIVVERDPETQERTIVVYRIRPAAPGLPDLLRS